MVTSLERDVVALVEEALHRLDDGTFRPAGLSAGGFGTGHLAFKPRLARETAC